MLINRKITKIFKRFWSHVEFGSNLLTDRNIFRIFSWILPWGQAWYKNVVTFLNAMFFVIYFYKIKILPST